jgi:hypothetical protein
MLVFKQLFTFLKCAVPFVAILPKEVFTQAQKRYIIVTAAAIVFGTDKNFNIEIASLGKNARLTSLV